MKGLHSSNGVFDGDASSRLLFVLAPLLICQRGMRIVLGGSGFLMRQVNSGFIPIIGSGPQEPQIQPDIGTVKP